MFTVIGGCYRENCLHPDWNQFVGSGGRALLAVESLVDKARLLTCVSNSERGALERLKRQTSNPITVLAQRESPIEFQYDYSAAVPRLFPDLADLDQTPPFDPPDDCENALLFSFIEFDAVPRVKARKLVYDPQAGHRAVPFSDTGSTADSLALVMNATEARTIAGRLGLENEQIGSAARSILDHEQAEVVVIKNGVLGALVVTADSQTSVPSFKTATTFAIGTGDIYSAAFAALWSERALDPVDAARLASAAVAFHAEHPGALPLPPELQEYADSLTPCDETSVSSEGTPIRSPDRVYLAGPFFDLPQKWLINEVYHSLKSMGLEVWSPSAEAGILAEKSSRTQIERVVNRDLEGLESCGSVFAILCEQDPGTLFEVGYAVKHGMGVTAYCNARSRQNLTMLLGSGCDVCVDLSTALYRAAWKAFHL